MEGHKKQNKIVGMVSSKQQVKVKEEKNDDMENEKEMQAKVKKNKNKEVGTNINEKYKALRANALNYTEREEKFQREMKIKEQRGRVDTQKAKKHKEEEQRKEDKEREGSQREMMMEKEQMDIMDKEKAKKDKEEEQRKEEKERKGCQLREIEDRKKEKEQREMMDMEKEKKEKEQREMMDMEKEKKEKEQRERMDMEKEKKKKKQREMMDMEKEKKEKKQRERMDMEKEKKEKEHRERMDMEKDKEEENIKKRKQQEKEVHEYKERKDEQHHERNDEDETTENTSPHFFKVVMPGESTQQLKIPRAFKKYLQNESSGVVSLRDASGNTWHVGLVANSMELSFVNGWERFFSDHCLHDGNFLVFRYNGQSQFSVLVFDRSGCEVRCAFLPWSCNDRVVEDDERGKGTNVDGTDPHEEDTRNMAEEKDGGDIGRNAGGTDLMREDIGYTLAEGDDKVDMNTNTDVTKPQEEDAGNKAEENDGVDMDTNVGGTNLMEEDPRYTLVGHDDKVDMGINTYVTNPQEEDTSNMVEENVGEGMDTNARDTNLMDSRDAGYALAKDGYEGDIDTNTDVTNPQEEDIVGAKSKASEEEGDDWPMGRDDALDTLQEKDLDGTANYAHSIPQEETNANYAHGTPPKEEEEEEEEDNDDDNDDDDDDVDVPVVDDVVADDDSDSYDFGIGNRKKRYRKIDDILAECDLLESKKRKAMEERPTTPLCSSYKVASSSSANVKGDTTTRSTAPVRSRFESTLFSKRNNVPQPGKVIAKVQRMPGLTSQRRAVTKEEAEDALERARQFHSHRAFSFKAMRPSEVYTTYFMVIPDTLVKNSLPKEDTQMMLWDPQGATWEVSYVYNGECSAAFSAGWGAFSTHNNLEESDVCVFEVLDSYNIKVHVHRVVCEITPCVKRPPPLDLNSPPL